MVEAPVQSAWLTIVGLGEDGLDGLSAQARQVIAEASIIMGPPRHLGLLGKTQVEQIPWPVPFADGLPLLEAMRGRQGVVVLASGDPFWFGTGSVLARSFAPQEWRALPGPSVFSLAATRLGWALEKVSCLGLHAAPLARLKPLLASGVQVIATLRDGAAVAALAAYLVEEGFENSRLTVLEALGGPRERLTETTAKDLSQVDITHPVAVAIDVKGMGQVIPSASGIGDTFFDTDGQITKRPMRALALSALAPKPFETLWDIGGGSGSIGIEWLLSHPTTQAISIEPREDRAARIRANADRLGVDRLQVVPGAAPEVLDGLATPDAVFIGGGLSGGLLEDLSARLPKGARLVAHAVTLESEALLAHWSEKLGGSLMRIELSETAPLGPKRGWKAAYPVVQWQVVL